MIFTSDLARCMSDEQTTLTYAADDREWMPRRGVEVLWAWWGLGTFVLELPSSVSMSADIIRGMAGGPVPSWLASIGQRWALVEYAGWGLVTLVSSMVCVMVLRRYRPPRVIAGVCGAFVLFEVIMAGSMLYTMAKGLLAAPISAASISSFLTTTAYVYSALAWPAMGLLLFGPACVGEWRERRAAARATFDASEFAKIAPSAAREEPTPRA